MVGQTISHYRVLEKLGEGGMGEVYKAQDATLGRLVALKFLAAPLLNDDEAKQRFLREARAAAALHHPNICTVFEVAEENGKTFLAMAYLEGESLEDLIAKGPLPLKDALEIGRQVAEGLKTAHAKGIVHRDIKPANVMVDGEGRATILDFGLARLSEASKLTRDNQTVGTAAYMSPEQMQGREVDHRTDIWAMGCVVHEMAAGVRPFKGEYEQALAYEIVNEEAELLTGLRSGVPMELELFVSKCLAKEPSRRYQSTAEILVDLETLNEKIKTAGSSIRRGPAVSQAITPPAAAGPRSSAEQIDRAQPRKQAIAYGVAAVAVLLALVFAFAPLLSPPPVAEKILRRFALPLPGAQVRGAAVAISPDGRHIAYTIVGAPSISGLWIWDLDRLEPRKIESAGNAVIAFWSPNSDFVAFRRGATREIIKVSLEGGPASTICSNCAVGYDYFSGAWSPGWQLHCL